MLRGLIAIVLSVIAGILLTALITHLAISHGFIRVEGGGALPTPNLDKVLIPFIMGFLGGLYGLFTSLITLILTNQKFLSYPVKIVQVISATAVFGLIHSIIWGLMEISNDVYGHPEFRFSNLQFDEIFITAAMGLISGCLIGAVSILLALFITKGFNGPERV